LFILKQAKPGEMENAVKDAISIGYRHLDSAVIYGNDHEVGAAVRAKVADGSVKREDLFITNKVLPSLTELA
jgi:diketogulonate reductase-like aldo/keto reductase